MQIGLVWSAVALAIAIIIGVFLIIAYQRIRRLEIEVQRIVSELSKLED